MNKRTRYTEEFKKDAVRMMLARGTQTLPEVAATIGVSKSMLYRWQQLYGSGVSGGAPLSQQERVEVEWLRRRLREVEMENTLLKKAAALFAKEMK